MATTKNRGGRPTREEASRKALERLAVDPATIDPRAILAAIAADASAPASARVSACRALLAPPADGADARAGDDLSRRALALLAQRAIN
jgi:hypothetical protein